MDSTLLVNKAFPELKELENLLRCGICYEFMKNTLITSCSHNYCSYCIRKSMQYKSQCPTCFKETSEPQLRNNRLVDQLIVLFLGMSDKIEGLLIERNWNHEDTIINTTVKKVPFNTPHSSERKDEGGSRADSTPAITPKVKILVPDMFTPKRKIKPRCPRLTEEPVNRVPCPVCSVEIPERNINAHLDACLAKSKKEIPKCSPQGPLRKPLPKLVYPLLNEKDLRKKLKELGLNTIGDRKALINRHQRYTVLYNSECDSLNPRPISEIVEQVENEENMEKKTSTNGNGILATAKTWLTVDKKMDEKTIEEAQKQYLNENKKNFAELIEKLKEQRKNPPTLQTSNVQASISGATSEREEENKQSDPKSPDPGEGCSHHLDSPDSPEICSIAEVEQRLTGTLHSSFDLFEPSRFGSPSSISKSIVNTCQDPKSSRQLSPPCTPGTSSAVKSPSKTVENEMVDSPPGLSRTISCSPPTPSSSCYSPYREFSPNVISKPDLERTPSPIEHNSSPSSPVVLHIPNKRSKLRTPVILSDDDEEDKIRNWLDVFQEEESASAVFVGRQKRRKKSLLEDLPKEYAESGGGRVLRKRQKK